MKKRIALIAVFTILLSLAGAVEAGESQTDTQAFRKEIVRLNYARADALPHFLNAFLGPGGRMTHNPTMPQILSISDTPENVARILEAIREIDVKPPDILFTVQLIVGSEADATVDKDLAKDPVIQELGKLLRYKGYALLDATVLRGVDRERSEVVLGPKADFELRFRPEVAKGQPQDSIKIELNLRHYDHPEGAFFEGKPVMGRQKDLIASTVNIKSGDRTVVGASRLDGGDKGLILIISAKTIY